MGGQLVGATCLYAAYDPVSRRRSAAHVGHPPPVVTAPDARGWRRRLPAGPSLGPGELPFAAREIDKLRPAATMRRRPAGGGGAVVAEAVCAASSCAVGTGTCSHTVGICRSGEHVVGLHSSGAGCACCRHVGASRAVQRA
ncbi:SpoIIE family protein phosphatase [Streptomyces antibioticus]|uniref:SpoIIE family protein phosphatase n=1 Tax=Streptomyces antibioticus TaxID=1890 RepID=UPI0033E6125E